MLKQSWLDQIDGWNPQLLRELKGRLKPRSLMLIVSSSILLQALLLYNNRTTDDWGDIFNALTMSIPFVLLMGGVYLLSSDLTQEQQRGTLNFIRLSPQSSQEILLGKLLGVPILLYLAVATLMPLHIVATVNAQLPSIFLLSFYSLVLALVALFYTAALLWSCITDGHQVTPWLLTMAGGYGAALCVPGLYYFLALLKGDASRSLSSPKLHWFSLPIENNLALGWSFLIVSCIVATHWLWSILNRNFRNPNGTIISKRQSYGLTFCFEIWFLGFLIPHQGLADYLESDGQELLAMVSMIHWVWFFVVMVALFPRRQTLMLWSGYRHKRARSHQRLFWRDRHLWKDLIWGENSPALLAFTINLAIAVSLLFSWVCLAPVSPSKPVMAIYLLLGLGMILLAGTVMQLATSLKTRLGSLSVLLGGILTFITPPIILEAFLLPDRLPVLWLLTVFPGAAMEKLTSLGVLGFALLGQAIAIGTMTAIAARQLRRLGRSSTQALLTNVILTVPPHKS